jgi:hypothetical protein
MVRNLETPAPSETTWSMVSGKIQLSQLTLLHFTGMIKLANNLKLTLTDKLHQDFNGRDHLNYKMKNHPFGVETASKSEHLNKVTLVIAGSCLLLLLLQRLLKELEISSMRMNTMTTVLSKLTCTSEEISKFKLLLMIESQLDGMVQTIHNHSFSLTMVYPHKVLGG